MDRKKVVLVTNSVPGLLNFRKELVDSLSEKYQVYILVPKNKLDTCYFEELTWNVIDIHVNSRGTSIIEDIKTYYSYKKYLSDISPDIVLTYTIKPNIYANMAAKKLSIPSIMNITGMSQALRVGKLKNIIRFLYRQGVRSSDLVFFQNEYNLKFFRENKILKNDKYSLLPGSGVNLERYSPLEIKIKEDKPHFLFIGRLMKEKGIDELIALSKHYKNEIQIDVLGSVAESTYEDLGPYINYHGSQKDIETYVAQADAIIHPSHHEGMSNVLLEGAAMGRPLLASNIPGCKEIIDDGKNGYLFEVKNLKSMIEAVEKFRNTSYEDRLAMGKYSREKVEREFDRKIVTQTYLDSIEDILGE